MTVFIADRENEARETSTKANKGKREENNTH